MRVSDTRMTSTWLHHWQRTIRGEGSGRESHDICLHPTGVGTKRMSSNDWSIIKCLIGLSSEFGSTVPSVV